MKGGTEESSKSQETKPNEVRRINGCSNGRATEKLQSNQSSEQFRTEQWDKNVSEENVGDSEERNRTK